MIKDMIYREDAIKAVKAYLDLCCLTEAQFHKEAKDYNEEISKEIFEEIEPKQGEWIESFKSVKVKRGAYLGTKFVHDGWSCSECSEVVEKRYPNCPYCLARMKGADDEISCRRNAGL